MVQSVVYWLTTSVSAHLVIVKLWLICDVPVHLLLDQLFVLLAPGEILLYIAAELILRPFLLWLARLGFIDLRSQGQLRIYLVVQFKLLVSLGLNLLSAFLLKCFKSGDRLLKNGI